MRVSGGGTDSLVWDIVVSETKHTMNIIPVNNLAFNF
jgi:hypothetical protein